MASNVTITDENDPILEESLLFTPRFNLERTPPPGSPGTPLPPLRAANTLNNKQRTQATTRSVSFTFESAVGNNNKTPHQQRQCSPLRSISEDSSPAAMKARSHNITSTPRKSERTKSRIPVSTPSRRNPAFITMAPTQNQAKPPGSVVQGSSTKTIPFSVPASTTKRSFSDSANLSNQHQNTSSTSGTEKKVESMANVITSLPHKTPIRTAGTQITSGGKLAVSIGPSRLRNRTLKFESSPDNNLISTPTPSAGVTSRNKNSEYTSSEDESTPTGRLHKLVIAKRTVNTVDGATSPMKHSTPTAHSKIGSSPMKTAVIKAATGASINVPDASRLPLPKTPERTPSKPTIPLSRRKLPTVDLTSPHSQRAHPAILQLLKETAKNKSDVTQQASPLAARNDTMLPPPPLFPPQLIGTPDKKTLAGTVKAVDAEEKAVYPGSPLTTGSPSRGRGGRQKKASELVRGIWTGKSPVLETGHSYSLLLFSQGTRRQSWRTGCQDEECPEGETSLGGGVEGQA